MAVWSISVPFGNIYSHFSIFCGHFGIFSPFWYIFTILVCCDEKNLATLHWIDLHRGQVFGRNTYPSRAVIPKPQT
jgi:hypothetical protein